MSTRVIELVIQELMNVADRTVATHTKQVAFYKTQLKLALREHEETRKTLAELLEQLQAEKTGTSTPKKRPADDDTTALASPPPVPKKKRVCKGCEMGAPSQRDHVCLGMHHSPHPSVRRRIRYTPPSSMEEEEEEDS